MSVMRPSGTDRWSAKAKLQRGEPFENQHRGPLHRGHDQLARVSQSSAVVFLIGFAAAAPSSRKHTGRSGAEPQDGGAGGVGAYTRYAAVMPEGAEFRAERASDQRRSGGWLPRLRR